MHINVTIYFLFGDLEVHDELLTIDGSVGYVLSFEVEKRDAPIAVYNIEVDDFHTYFVGDGVMVHNSCPNPNGKKGGQKHQDMINQTIEILEQNGYKVKKEFYVKIADGFKTKRFADIIAVSPDGATVLIQVGKQLKSGMPVMRERKAIWDLLTAGYDILIYTL